MLGSDLVLLRLRDALGELDGIEGAQVHRSWWVARDAVESVERDGRSVRLVLPRGIAAPVARSRIAELTKAGWF
jgi:DNA-binding LytR/AlgR family response regulator